MKLNWGTSIVIAFGLFMIFILQFVFKVQSSNQYDHEMVTEDYYKKEKPGMVISPASSGNATRFVPSLRDSSVDNRF